MGGEICEIDQESLCSANTRLSGRRKSARKLVEQSQVQEIYPSGVTRAPWRDSVANHQRLGAGCSLTRLYENGHSQGTAAERRVVQARSEARAHSNRHDVVDFRPEALYPFAP
jgi:hypothetical protein